MTAIILTIINNKGGISKTSSSINIGAYLSSFKGKKVLLVDFDAQSNLTEMTVGDEHPNHVGEWLVGEKTFDEVVVNFQSNFDVLPAKRALDTYQKAIGAEQDYQFIFKEKLEEDGLHEKYDFIIIDNQPSLSTLAYTTFIAATHVLVPSLPEEYSIKGIENIMQTVVNVRKRYNPTLKVVGIFFNKYHESYRIKIDNDLVNGAKTDYPNLVLETTIRNNVSIREASAFKQSVFQYAIDSNGALDYAALTEEVLKRL